MQKQNLHRLVWLLAAVILLTALVPAALGESADEAGRWEQEADQIDQYLDTAFALFLEGKTAKRWTASAPDISGCTISPSK